jgi:hypothetical protein
VKSGVEHDGTESKRFSCRFFLHGFDDASRSLETVKTSSSKMKNIVSSSTEKTPPKKPRNTFARPGNDPPRLAVKLDIAQRYKVSKRTVDYWMAEGLPYRKINGKTVRFDPLETDAWVDTFKVAID